MRNLFLIYIFLICQAYCFSQQTGQFTQFTFNKYGYNPAADGTNINGKLEIITGIRKQWLEFDLSPYSNFFSANYTFKPLRSYRRWHNAGIYISQDNAGVFRNLNIYGSYTMHLHLSKRLVASFGVFAGTRKFSLNKTLISPADPVSMNSTGSFYSYPDIIPGVRIYSKKLFFDLSVQQLYKNRQKQGGKEIGNASKLTPQIYFSAGKKFYFGNDFIIVPALNMHSSLTFIPNVELNLMVYYNNRIGVGATIRQVNFISGILQIRVLKNLTAGFAYDYSINKISAASANSVEFMIGVTPMISGLNDSKPKRQVAKCPALDF